MKFKCIKTVEFTFYPKNEPIWHKKSSPMRYPFIDGETYKIWEKGTTRTNLELINESGDNHGVGIHQLHWSFAKFFKEHFIIIK